MNRLESLQYYPGKFRQFFFFGIPTVLILFTLAILFVFFGIPFKETVNFWYVPALLGGICTYFLTQRTSNTERKPNAKDIEADPDFLKGELEKANTAIVYLVGAFIATFAFSAILRPLFYKQLGQIIDLCALLCFFLLGAYFREILHVYSRIPGVKEEDVNKRYPERSMFSFLGWLSLFFLFVKTLSLKGKMGNVWEGLPDFFLPNFVLVAGLAVYLVSILGILFVWFTNSKNADIPKGLLPDRYP